MFVRVEGFELVDLHVIVVAEIHLEFSHVDLDSEFMSPTMIFGLTFEPPYPAPII
jgi:hypothetical protein